VTSIEHQSGGDVEIDLLRDLSFSYFSPNISPQIMEIFGSSQIKKDKFGEKFGILFVFFAFYPKSETL
jgi:hypothetical protein